MLRYTDRQSQTWFSRLVRHPARKRSGPILTTPEPAWGESAEAGTRWCDKYVRLLDGYRSQGRVHCRCLCIAHMPIN